MGRSSDGPELSPETRRKVKLLDRATGVSNGITCECGAVLEVAAYAVADYDVEFEVREKPGRMDPVEQRRSQ